MLSQNKELKVCEEEESYEIEISNSIQYPHDKLIKTILSDKDEAAKVINKYLNLQVMPEQLEKYISSYITKDFRTKESDIVYKMKDKKIFFLIEHQSTIDRKMPYRLYEYSSAIMRESIDKKEENKKDYLYPKVISIVIYTGSKKWDIKTSLEEVQEKLEGYEDTIGTYKLIDVNSYEEEELLKDKLMTSKIMLIDRQQEKERIEEIVSKIMKEIKEEKQREELYRIIEYVLAEKLTKEKKDKLLNKLRGGIKEMTGTEILYREYQKCFENGRKEGIERGIEKGLKEAKKEKISIIKNLIKLNLDETTISKATGVNKKEIQKIKETMKKEK